MGDTVRWKAVKCDRVGHLSAEETCAVWVIGTKSQWMIKKKQHSDSDKDKDTWNILAFVQLAEVCL